MRMGLILSQSQVQTFQCNEKTNILHNNKRQQVQRMSSLFDRSAKVMRYLVSHQNDSSFA